MTPDVFAANRGTRLADVDKELLPVVTKALTHWKAKTDWYESIVEGASVLWSEMFEESVPDADKDQQEKLLAAFQKDLRATLTKTQDPKSANSDQAQVITEWVSTSTSNHAELRAARVNKHPALRWVTRHDDRVRSTHAAIDGTTVPAGQTFKVGNAHLAYPGEPVGDPSLWLRCRCLLQRVGKGMSMAGNATAFTEDPALVAALATDEPDDTVPVEPQDDLVTETPAIVPFHGVAAPTDTESGDGRKLARAGASFRTMPLPMSWQRTSADGHMQSTVVGRIDTMSLDETTGNVIYDGVFNSTPEAQEAIQGVAEGWLRGVSVDVDMAEMEMPDEPDDEDMMDLLMGTGVTVFSSWRIAGVTMVSIPAFEQAFIALGPVADDPNPQVDDGAESVVAAAESAIENFGVTSNPSTRDGPGWETDPEDTQRLRKYWTHGAGAAKIAWSSPGDFDRCRSELGKYVEPQYLAGTCANLHKVATGAWPGHAPGEQASGRTIVASAAALWDTISYGKTEDSTRSAILAQGGQAGLRRVLEVVGDADGPEGRQAAGRPLRAGLESGRPATAGSSSGVGVDERSSTGRADAGPSVSRTAVLQSRAPRTGGPQGEHEAAVGSSGAQTLLPEGAFERGIDVERVRALLDLSSGKPAPSVSLVASAAPMIPPGDWFQDPKLSDLTPFTVLENGRCFGHISGWSICHVGFDKVCTTAPHSASNYAYYRTGEIDTTLGPVNVGQITMGAGHANMRADAATAAAHYDNVAHAVADVAAGEDEHGIWVAGSLRPGVHEDDVRALRAASLSGDWRRIRGGMEMVAALAVNVPGFPIPRNALAASGQDQLSLVAAGVVQEETQSTPTEDFDGRVALAVERVLSRRDRVAGVRERAALAARQARLARAKRIKES